MITAGDPFLSRLYWVFFLNYNYELPGRAKSFARWDFGYGNRQKSHSQNFM